MGTIYYDHQIFSRQHYGGISRYFCQLIPRLAALDGWHPKVIAGAYANQYLRQLPPALVRGAPISLSARWLKMLERGNRAFFAAYSHWHLPDIVHQTYYAPWRLAPRSSRLVVTVYDLIHEKFPHYFRPDDPTRDFKRRAVQRADRVICISEQTRRDLLEQIDLDADKITVIYLGPPTPLPPDSEASSPKPSPPFLLYVGAREGYKNFAQLLQAYGHSAHLRQSVDLVCFGGGPFTAEEKRQMVELGLSPSQVQWRSSDDRTLAALYRQAIAFVYPSRYEGFGLPVLEAMTYGCPVICSQTSSLPEVAGSAAEYIDPDQPDSLIHALESVVDSPTRRSTLTQLGYQQVDRFSWDYCAQQTAQAYRSLL